MTGKSIKIETLTQVMVEYAELGKIQVVEAFVTAGVPIDAKTSMGQNAINAAAAGGHTEACLRMLDLGFPVDGVDGFGNGPVDMAIYHGHNQTASKLAARGCSDTRTDTERQANNDR
ncbi:MAG: ankyrin repeat domain-containing protein [Candidatus Pacebacteria bacterium]|nr:ankyrin repeat domain-containing protein [Candidatus Paceibacterota bacterium]